MSRITNHQYIASHRQLQHTWRMSPALLSVLVPRDQWYLHDYFRFSEQLSEAELLAHRLAVSSDRPALPQEAGRALARLTRSIESGCARLPTQSGRLSIRSVVRPQVNVDLLAQAIVQLAEHLAAQDADDPNRQQDGSNSSGDRAA